MERGAAEECAKAYTRLVDTVLVEQIEEADRLSELTGFGGFSSAGFVIFRSTRTTEGHRAGLGLCDGVPEIATALEPEIGKEN